MKTFSLSKFSWPRRTWLSWCEACGHNRLWRRNWSWRTTGCQHDNCWELGQQTNFNKAKKTTWCSQSAHHCKWWSNCGSNYEIIQDRPRTIQQKKFLQLSHSLSNLSHCKTLGFWNFFFWPCFFHATHCTQMEFPSILLPCPKSKMESTCNFLVAKITKIQIKLTIAWLNYIHPFTLNHSCWVHWKRNWFDIGWRKHSFKLHLEWRKAPNFEDDELPWITQKLQFMNLLLPKSKKIEMLSKACQWRKCRISNVLLEEWTKIVFSDVLNLNCN